MQQVDALPAQREFMGCSEDQSIHQPLSLGFMKSYLISELVAFSVLSDSSNQIIAAAAMFSVLSD